MKGNWDMTDFPPLGHVAITVRSQEASKPWYAALFGADPALDENTGPWHHVVWALPGGTLIGIHEHPGKTSKGDAFSEYRIGLDHVSFHCASRVELEKWAGRLDELGVTHGGIEDAPYGSGLSFRDPDGNALEFFAAPGT
jgi:catechol 2,3-dioxygenase-like lactoylglutathione lyase family enzyme